MTDRYVAFYLHHLYNGGIERVICNLAHEFVARGVRVDIVVNNEGWSPFASQIPKAVRVVDLGVRRFVDRPLKLIRYLRRERPNALLSSQHFSNEIAVLSATIASRRTRVVLWEHTTLSIDLQALPRFSIRRIALPPLAWLAYRYASSIVSVSSGVAVDVSKTFGIQPEKITTIYNPVLAPDIYTKSQMQVDHPWLSDGQPPVILGVGRLEAAKDYPTLIEAFAQVRATMPAHLIILGEGSLRSQLMEQIRTLGIEADVELTGFVQNPYAYLSRARLFVLSSAWEGFANVLVEALALGVEVVSTNCRSGPAEILDSGRYGELVPVKNPQLLAKAILDVIAGNAKAKPTKGWLSQFTSATAADQFLEILGIQCTHKAIR